MTPAPDPTARDRFTRTFIALPVPPSHREALDGHLSECARAAPGFRWVPSRNLHLTLRFCGRLDPGRLAALSVALRDVRAEPFPLRLGGLGRFGRNSRDRVVWIGLAEGSDEVVQLAARVEAACVTAGLPPEARPLHPHVTLARSKTASGERLAVVPPVPELPAWTVSDLVLYRSSPRIEGSVYTELERFSLEAR